LEDPNDIQDKDEFGVVLSKEDKDDLKSTRNLNKYDCWDLDMKPKEWIKKCRFSDVETHAKTPVFDKHEYKWLNCKVTE